MAYQRDVVRRDLVIKACEQAKDQGYGLPGRPTVYRRVSEVLDMPYPMVCHYARDIKPKEHTARNHYDPVTLQWLLVCTSKQKKDYAEKRGVTIRALDLAIARFRKAGLVNAALTKKLVDTRNPYTMMSDTVNRRGYINIKNVEELHHFDIRLKDLVFAKQYLKTLNLHLRAPNVLLHKPSHKHHYLTRQEQYELIMAPKEFLKALAASGGDKLSAFWTTAEAATESNGIPFTDALWYFDKFQGIKPKVRVGNEYTTMEEPTNQTDAGLIASLQI